MSTTLTADFPAPSPPRMRHKLQGVQSQAFRQKAHPVKRPTDLRTKRGRRWKELTAQVTASCRPDTDIEEIRRAVLYMQQAEEMRSRLTQRETVNMTLLMRLESVRDRALKSIGVKALKMMNSGK